MTHIEAIEPRRLTAHTGLDPAFGTGGTTTLRGVVHGDAVVTFPGGLFVEAVAKGGVGYLYKLTAAGRVDTAFGDGGRIATPAFNVDALAYDKRYGLLYAAGVTTQASGPDYDPRRTATLCVARFDGKTGRADASFGDSGVASLTYGRTGSGIDHNLTVGRLMPLSRRGLVVAFEHTIDPASDSTDGTDTQAIDVGLLKYTAAGRRDRSFGRRGIAGVASGVHTSLYGHPTTHDRFSESHFADLQGRADGSLRVIITRRSGTEDTTDDDFALDTVDDKLDVRSQVVTKAGVADAAQEHVWRVAVTTPDDSSNFESGEYEPLVVRADGDSGVVVVGRRVTNDPYGDPHVATFDTVTLAPDRHTTAPLNVSAERNFSTVLSFARGYYVVEDLIDVIYATKLRPDFSPAPGYNGGAETVTPVVSDYDDEGQFAIDPDGNLLVLHANQISRIRG